MYKYILISLLAASIFSLASCGKKKGKSNPSGDPQQDAHGDPVGTLKLNLAVAHSPASTASLRLLDDDDPDYRFEATSMLSGPADEMEIFIKSILLRNAEGPSVHIFQNDEGKPIRINGAKFDLSELFTSFECITDTGQIVELGDGESCECGLDTNGNLISKIERAILDEEGEETEETELVCDIENLKTPPIAVLEVAPATYESIEVTYRLGALMKGCVSGYFRDDNEAPGVVYGERSSYCTKADGSYFKLDANVDATHFHADSDWTAEWVMVPINRGGLEHAGGADNDNMIVYPIPGGLNLTAGETADLTFVIDTNRMLRFNNAGRADVTPKEGTTWSKERAYFFNSVFADSAFMFVGRPGEIRGYEWKSRHCTVGEDIDRSEDYACNVFIGGDERRGWDNIEGWLSIIFDSDDQPYLMSFMPDDDGASTVIKGANAPETRFDEDFVSRFNPNAFVGKTEANRFDLRFGLQRKEGVIYDFPLDLPLGESTDFLKYEGLTEDEDVADSEEFGLVTFTRRL